LEKTFGSKEMALMAFFNGEGAMRHAQSKMATVRLADEAAVWAFLYAHLPASTRDDLYRWNAMAAAMSSPGMTFAPRHPLVTVGDTQGVPMPKPTQLKALADVLGVPMATLQTANPALLGDIIPQGARLNLPVDKADVFPEKRERIYAYQDSLASIPKKKPVPVVPAIPIPANADKITYTVRPGDNLGQIALRHGVALSQLKAWNGLSSDRINAGQKLTIYGHANPNFKVEEKPTPPPVKVNTTEGTFFHYVVKQGDTLWSISRQFEGVSVEDIQKWNGIGERIDIGQVLKIKKP
jgi:membrane-bound lytic murein transglycosylase D